jgi:hypothetical protein
VLEDMGKDPSKRVPASEVLAHATAMFGGEIRIADTPDWEEVDGGSLVIDPAGSFVIWLSPVTSPLRDNFTIAHELGHYFLHYVLATPQPKGRVTFHRYGSGPREMQANRFAAAFLMPRKEFIAAQQKFGPNSLKLARHFEVSEPAVKVRLDYVRPASKK